MRQATDKRNKLSHVVQLLGLSVMIRIMDKLWTNISSHQMDIHHVVMRQFPENPKSKNPWTWTVDFNYETVYQELNNLSGLRLNVSW